MARYDPLPYVREVRPRNLRLADLYLRQGEAQAEAERRRGDITAQLWGNVGQAISQAGTAIVQAPQQERERKAKELAQAQEAEARGLQIGEAKRQVNERENFDLAMSAGSKEKTLAALKDRPELYAKAQQHFDNIESSQKKMLGDVAAGIADFGYTPEAAMAAMDHLIESGYDERKIEPFRAAIQKNPESVKQIVTSLLSQSPDPRHQAMAKPQPLVELNENTNLYDPNQGRVVATGPPKPTPREPNPTEASLAVAAAAGDQKALAALALMRKQHPSTSSAPGEVAMSPDAIEEAAHRVRLYGPSSIPTRFNEADKKRILNRSAEINKSIGQTPAAAAMRAAVQKADQGALNQITKMASSAEAFENKALQQADLVKELSGKVARTDFPIINGALVSGKAALGNTPAHLLANALLTYTSEYAKIIEGSTGSAAGSSDAARRAAATLISTALSKGTLAATVDQMNREMGMTRTGYRTTIDDITNRMGGGSTVTDPNAPRPGDIEYDINGKPIEKGKS